jgi:hypothetical protein
VVPIINGREVIAQAKFGTSKTSVWLLGIARSKFVGFLCLICLVDGNFILCLVDQNLPRVDFKDLLLLFLGQICLEFFFFKFG